ncbi:hypothetical protein Pelo_10454 [Pelomyxa schiedti]|nr:hypothetical protein Pelo_10454 [Pelomyxa schiedti]
MWSRHFRIFPSQGTENQDLFCPVDAKKMSKNNTAPETECQQPTPPKRPRITTPQSFPPIRPSPPRLEHVLSAIAQFVAFACGALIPRCYSGFSDRSSTCYRHRSAVGLLCGCSSLVAEFGKSWVVCGCRDVGLTLPNAMPSPEDFNLPRPRLHVFLSLSHTLGVVRSGMWTNVDTLLVEINGCIGKDRFILTHHQDRGLRTPASTSASVVSGAGQVIGVLRLSGMDRFLYHVVCNLHWVVVDEGTTLFLWQVADGVPLLPPVQIDHHYEGSATAFCGDNDSILIRDHYTYQSFGRMERSLQYIDLASSFSQRNLVVSKVVSMPEELYPSGLIPSEPAYSVLPRGVYNTATRVQHSLQGDVHAVDKGHVGVMRAMGRMEVFGIGDLTTPCGCHNFPETQLVKVSHTAGVAVWKVWNPERDPKKRNSKPRHRVLVLADGVSGVRLANVTVFVPPKKKKHEP